jgi:hypothetical protein
MKDDSERMLSLLEQRRVLIAYLLSKVEAEDYHAVSDSAMDIREIDVRIECLASKASKS